MLVDASEERCGVAPPLRPVASRTNAPARSWRCVWHTLCAAASYGALDTAPVACAKRDFLLQESDWDASRAQRSAERRGQAPTASSPAGGDGEIGASV